MRYYPDPKNTTKYPDGSILFRTPAPFSSVAKVENCLCPDGRRRTVWATGEPDTFFSIPAIVKVRGKNVSGYLTTYRDEPGKPGEGWEFRAYKYGKNYSVFSD